MDAIPSPPFRPLQSRPEATALTVRDLIQRVQAGRMRVPEFQRPLRWQRRQNLELLDSIWRGYPIGSLLFWKRSAPEQEIQIGTARLHAQSMSEAWWVVDGQQRITALAGALLDLEQAPGEHRWELYFDVDGQRLVEANDSGTCVPLSVLGDLRRLGKYVREVEWCDEETLVGAAEDAQQRILDYSIPAYVVDTASEDALRAIFARLNSTGARMRTEEVFHALFGRRSAEPAAEHQHLDLERLQEVGDRDGFGRPSRSEVLKMVLAMSDEDPTRRVEHLTEQKLASLVSSNEAEDVVARVVSFLQEDAGIPHVRLVPYPVVFSILARWFRHFPDPNAWNRRRLIRWLWRGAATSAHQRAEVSKMREQLRLVQEDESESMRRLLERVPLADARPWKLAPFNGQSAHSRIETLALLSLEPLSAPEVSVADVEGDAVSITLSPHRIDPRSLMARDRIAREVFASHDWEGLDEGARRLARSGANRVLLEEGHTGLQSQLRPLDPIRHAQVLGSHLIDDQTFEALRNKDVPAFLELRGRALQRLVTSFLADQCAEDEPLGLAPLSEYLDREGD